MEFKSVSEIDLLAPFPWTQQVLRGGIVRLLDANGTEVPLFAITGLAVLVTQYVANAGKNKKET